MKNKGFILILITLLLGSCSRSNTDIRSTENFNTGWLFTLSDEEIYSAKEFDHSDWRHLRLPHDWSIEADFSNEYPATPGGGALPGGTGWYRKEFDVPATGNGDKLVFIDFEGVYRNSTVWVNGHYVGHRPNGYSSFRYDITPYLDPEGSNVIAVRVDNSEQPNSRWYTGSGIYRDVRLVTVDRVHIPLWGVFVKTVDSNPDTARLAIETDISNLSDSDRQVTVRFDVLDAAGKKVASATLDVGVPTDSVTVTTTEISVKKPRLWSVDDPQLYTLVTSVETGGKTVDRLETVFGIRTFGFDPEKGFSLNGEPMKILGVCMHHDLGCLGSAAYRRAIERQLEILKGMGCNSIRTAHNPPSPQLLELCDRMGFIVQDEAFDMWLKRKSPYDYARDFTLWHEQDLQDMVLRDRNHPSVMMWSIGNEILEQWSDFDVDNLDLQQANLLFNFAGSLSGEGEDDELNYSSLLTVKLADMVHRLDGTRPVTSGNNEARPINNLFRSGAMDIIGINYNDRLWARLPQMYPGKNFIITESTSSLMTRGHYEMPSDVVEIKPERWDIPYFKEGNQCSSYDNSHVPWGTTHERSWLLVRQMDHISGIYVWTGFDYLGEPTPYWWPSRSSYFGIVDLAGFPKDVYYMYRSEWTDEDVLHIFPHWNWTEGETVDIWAYYNNADEVELFLDGRSLGVRAKEGDEMHVRWRLEYSPGTLEAVSRRNGKEVLRRRIATAGTPVTIRLTADRATIDAGGGKTFRSLRPRRWMPTG